MRSSRRRRRRSARRERREERERRPRLRKRPELLHPSPPETFNNAFLISLPTILSFLSLAIF
jgi:hypothetical protein